MCITLWNQIQQTILVLSNVYNVIEPDTTQTILVLSNVYNVIEPDTTNYFSIIKCV